VVILENAVVSKRHLPVSLLVEFTARVIPAAVPSICAAAFKLAESTNACASFFVMNMRPMSIARPATPSRNSRLMTVATRT